MADPLDEALAVLQGEDSDVQMLCEVIRILSGPVRRFAAITAPNYRQFSGAAARALEDANARVTQWSGEAHHESPEPQEPEAPEEPSEDDD